MVAGVGVAGIGVTGVVGGGAENGALLGRVGFDGGGGAKVGFKLRGKSSAAIQLSIKLAAGKSASRLKPVTHSEKRRGKRLRRQ
jgi:hypothetical protein